MKKIFALTLGVSLLLSACGRMALAAPEFIVTRTTMPPRPTETATVISSPTWTPTATVAPSITPTFTASPIPTATWIHLGPGTVIVPIILYHRIDVSPINSQFYVPPEKFEAEMKLLHDWGYTTITTEMLAKAITEGADLPPRPIIITFDDGHLNNYTSAFPIMRKYHFTGSLYVVGNYVGAQNYLNVEQIKKMAAEGWEIGSHSMNHRDLTTLDPEHQRFEIVESRKKLEDALGVRVTTFAYPFGLSNAGVIDYVHFAGYTSAMSLGFTYDQGDSNLFTLQRRDIKGTYDIKQFAAFLPWKGDPSYLPTDTPTPTATPTRTPIPTYTQYPTRMPKGTSTSTP